MTKEAMGKTRQLQFSVETAINASNQRETELCRLPIINQTQKNRLNNNVATLYFSRSPIHSLNNPFQQSVFAYQDFFREEQIEKQKQNYLRLCSGLPQTEIERNCLCLKIIRTSSLHFLFQQRRIPKKQERRLTSIKTPPFLITVIRKPLDGGDKEKRRERKQLCAIWQLQFSLNNKHMLLGLSAKIIKATASTHCAPLFLPFLPTIRYLKASGRPQQVVWEGADEQGTEYNKWVLARSARGNHDVACLRRRQARDRYSIHKLTNMEFMCSLASRDDKYQLHLNEKIVLLAQMNHVCNVLKKDKGAFVEFGKLAHAIADAMQHPEDYICTGTFINVLVDLGQLSETVWIAIMDALLLRKYDQEYDELFGVYAGLWKYRRCVEEVSDYFELQRNRILYNIPVVYRNSLETVRQYIRYNSYNLKQCRILLRALHQAKINDGHFWHSVADWFNIFVKEQLQQRQFEEYFIVAQSAVEKVLFDDGVIRPRSILEETSEIAFILSQHKVVSHRYLSFIESLIIYSIENGADLFNKFLEIERAQKQRRETEALNDHMRLYRSSEQEELAKMERRYKTIFVNPTDLRSETVIQALVVLKRVYDQRGEEEKERNKYDQKRQHSVDNRVLNWLVVRLCQSKMQYTVNELIKIIECRHILAALRVDIKGLVLEKVKNVRTKECSLADLRDLFYFLPLIEFQSIAYILDYFLSRAHPKDILQLTQLFQSESMSSEDYETYGEEPQKGKKEGEGEEEARIDRSHLSPKEKNKRWMPYLASYFLRLPEAVNSHEKYYSFEENCYFLYILLKNQEYWQASVDYIYLGEMEKLKHSIKIASYSRGFKLQMGTYFYKLMNYIDLVSFFDGGA